MGVSASLSLHAGNRDEFHRKHDLRNAPPEPPRYRRRLSAGLIWFALAGSLQAETLRIAVFHTELSRDGPGLLLRDITDRTSDTQAAAQVVARADPDVILLLGFDYDLGQAALGAFAALVSEAGNGFPHLFAYPSNAGRYTGWDLDHDGRLGGPDDAEGYGRFAGQGGMAILSKLPVIVERSRDLSGLIWRELPGTLLNGSDGFPDRPLSSRGHWDVALEHPDYGLLRLWTWHATPPVFDGPEDLNGRRNHDETQVWLDYLDGTLGEVPDTYPFVLAGNANLDPGRGEGRREALARLLLDPRISDPRPRGPEGRTYTADWPDGPGQLRVDYILPSYHWRIDGAGIIRPGPLPSGSGPEENNRGTRHGLVWVDLVLKGEHPDLLQGTVP